MPQRVLTKEDARVLSRRASVRYRCEQPTARRVFLLETYRSFTAEVADLSHGGVGFIVSHPLKPGMLLFVDLMGLEVPVEFLAKVVHATRRPTGDYAIGCEFDRPLTHEELNMVLKRSA